ncbi:MAG: lysophospholipid acyltransferase family protein [Longimicrobiales bacterium]
MGNSVGPARVTASPTLAHRAEYALLAGAVAIGRRVSEPAAARLGAFLGRLAYRPFGFRRRIVEDNLRRAFPDCDMDWVRLTAAASYEHFARETIAQLRSAQFSSDQIVARTTFEGWDALQDAVRAGNGVVIVAGHLGNWEMGAAAVAARGVPTDVVVQRQSNPLSDHLIVQSRAGIGLGIIDRRHAAKLALRSLRAGRTVAFVSDQDAGKDGVFVPFFGRLASTHRGAALMAIRTGAPLFLGVPLRVAAGPRYVIRIREILTDRSGQLDEAVQRLTAAYTALLESAIRSAPDQYLWLHRRWKTRPPEERSAGGAV